MKAINIFLIIAQLITAVSCKSHKQFSENKLFCHLGVNIQKKEKINKEINSYFSKNSGKKKVSLRDDNLFHLAYWKLSKGQLVYKETNKTTKITKWVDYYNNGVPKNNYFQYDLGNVIIGIETHYDTIGNITKVIDHDKGYKICWAQAIAIVKHRLRHKLKKYDDVEFLLRRVDMNDPDYINENPEWYVGVIPIPDDKPNKTTFYEIDGVTGEILGKYYGITKGHR